MELQIHTGLLRTYRGKLFYNDEQTFRRFMAKVSIVASGCWEWTGACARGGYGHFSVHCPDRVKMKMIRCSIYVHAAVNKQICEVVRHTCDNPSCVNPSHLLSGTYTDNSMDAVIRGRTAKGHKTTSKDKRAIDETIVKEIFKMKSNGYTGRAIAGHFGLSPQTISRVLLRHTWAWVEVD